MGLPQNRVWEENVRAHALMMQSSASRDVEDVAPVSPADEPAPKKMPRPPVDPADEPASKKMPRPPVDPADEPASKKMPRPPVDPEEEPAPKKMVCKLCHKRLKGMQGATYCAVKVSEDDVRC